MNRQIEDIIIHCSDTRPGQLIDDRPVDAETIRKWHTAPPPQGNGWSDIGYHFVILEDGTIEPGRPVERIGAHVRGHNEHSIGICLVGGRSESGDGEFTFTAAQGRSLLTLVSDLQRQIGHLIRVRGHRDYDKSKECPCFNAANWWKTGRWE